MQLLKNISLKKYNTFAIDVSAKLFCEVSSKTVLQQMLESEIVKSEKKLILGGGSNILFTKDFDGIVIKNNIGGMEAIYENENYALIKSGSGVIWHDLVLFSIARNLGGIENLSLIPGCVGASPIQNIGAYGVELKDVFYELEAIEIISGAVKIFNAADCKFGYRDSVFKNEAKNQFVIVSVTLKLNKHPVINSSYGAIENELKKTNVDVPTVKDVSDAVIKIRKSKLPDPAAIGNAGSFFKNPEISKEKFLSLKSTYEKIAAYDLPHGNVKLAAGWLIEQCGWKGKITGHTGSHKDQALVLVNYGNATGNEIFDLAKKIQQSVFEKFGVQIETEVNII